jgi:glycosyltransferase involved in cell wall biosynthesis
MRILELVNNLEIGGAERMVVDLSKTLHERGHEVHVACLRRGGPLTGVLASVGIPAVTFEKSGGFNWKVAAEMGAYCAQHEIDVVHTHNPLVHHYGVLAARRANVPVVVNTVHGPANVGRIGRALAIFEASCLWSSNVVACCEAVGQHVRKATWIARRKTCVIPNGIPLERFLAIQRPAPGKEFVFGTVGRLVPVKDQRSLLRAFALLRSERSDCRLEILGDGPLRAELEQEAETLGIRRAVTFHGSSLDVAQFLARIDTFLLTSTSEGLPLTLLEAMAAALPVIGTAVGAIPELVSSANAGWVCAPGNVSDLASAMKAAATSPLLPEMGRRARQLVSREYSLLAMTSAYERLFQQQLEARRRSTTEFAPGSAL